MFNKWLLFLSTHPFHSPPAFAPPAITCFFNRSHVISWCSFWRCLTLHSCQAEVRLRVRSSDREVVVRGSSLVPCLPVRRPSSTPFLTHTHGMASPSTIVLVPRTFCTVLRFLGEFYFSARLPKPSFSVEPHLPLGILAIPHAPSHLSFVPSPFTLVRSLSLKTRRDLTSPVN